MRTYRTKPQQRGAAAGRGGAAGRRGTVEKRQQLEAAKAELSRLKAMKASAQTATRAKSPVEEELDAAMAERDALLELKREKEERQKAEAAASLARTRSAEKRLGEATVVSHIVLQ